MKKYGGVQNAVLIDEVVEAQCVVLAEHPDPVSPWPRRLRIILAPIKILPITLLLLAIMWGVDLLLLWLFS